VSTALAPIGLDRTPRSTLQVIAGLAEGAVQAAVDLADITADRRSLDVDRGGLERAREGVLILRGLGERRPRRGLSAGNALGLGQDLLAVTESAHDAMAWTPCATDRGHASPLAASVRDAARALRRVTGTLERQDADANELLVDIHARLSEAREVARGARARTLECARDADGALVALAFLARLEAVARAERHCAATLARIVVQRA
jgi:hypothetical protein